MVESEERTPQQRRRRADAVAAAAVRPSAGAGSGRRRTYWALVATAIVMVIVGVVVLLSTNQGGSAAATVRPRENYDHWHAAFGIDDCGTWLGPLLDTTPDTLGIHSHGDGLIHIHPFAPATSGHNATLARFLDQVGVKVTSSKVSIRRHPTLRASEGCDGTPARIVIARWSAAAVRSKGHPTAAASPDQVVFSEDRTAVVIAVIPTSSKVGSIPLPPSVAGLADPTAAENGNPTTSLDPNPTSTTTG